MKSVKFGRSSAQRVVDRGILDRIKGSIEDCLNYSIDRKRYSLLNEKNLTRLEDTQHQVGINTLGQRYLLLLATLSIEGKPKPYSIFINRKSGMMIVVRFRFSSHLYATPKENDSCAGTQEESGDMITTPEEGGDCITTPKESGDMITTLLEGELIKTKSNLLYYVASDLLVYQGRCLPKNDFQDRINILNQIVKKQFCKNVGKDPCQIRVKKYYGYEHISSIIRDYVPSLPYREAVTGLSFKANQGRSHMIYILPEYRTTTRGGGTVAKPVKSEDANGHFRVVAETDLPDVYELYDSKNNSAGFAMIPDTETSRLMKTLLEESGDQQLYVKCKFDKKFSKWAPYERAGPF